MGFFKKLANWITGKGWRDDIITTEEQIPTQPTEMEEAEQKQYEKKDTKDEEKQKAIPTEKTKELPKKEEKPETEMEKAVKQYEKSPKVSTYEGKIDEKTVNRVQLPTIPQDLGELRPYYSKVFTENAKLRDPEILDILIQNRKKLQHRFIIQVLVLFDGEKTGGTLRVYGTLIEHATIIHNFLNIGQEVEYLQEVLQNIGSTFETQFGAINYETDVTNQNGKVSDIIVDVSFA